MYWKVKVVCIEWYEDNQMQANPGKFQAFAVGKKKKKKKEKKKKKKKKTTKKKKKKKKRKKKNPKKQQLILSTRASLCPEMTFHVRR